MTRFSRLHTVLWAAAMLTAWASPAAQAAPIEVTISGTGSGTLGSLSFSDAGFTIRTTGDTAARRTIDFFPPEVYDVPMDTAEISIAGLPTATFSLPTRVFVNHGRGGPASAGFSRGGSDGTDILNIESSAFATWDLLTNIGPVFDATLGPLSQAGNLGTSAGPLTFTAYRNGTFNAVVVPEPAGLIAVAASALPLLLRRRRRS